MKAYEEPGIHISGLRKESAGGWTKLVADITYSGGGVLPSNEPVIWLAVKDENAHMLADDVYDAFVLVPLYMAMYMKADLYIHGKMSKRLYKNIVNYLQRILCDFSPDLSRVNVSVDGFAEAQGEQSIIGTGISCGVDSLTTIYDRYVMEDDPDYRVNGLFFFNYGSCGDYGEEASRLWMERYEMNKAAADELGLPVYLVDSNLHAFTHAKELGGTQAGYFANWSIILGLGCAIKKYYTSSCYSYSQMMEFGRRKRGSDFAEYSEAYSVPLIRTERLELIIDGCQYERSMKTEHIADWEIARKHLNVCVVKSDGISDAHNCSKCAKCMMTLLTLDAIGKLDNFSGVFDLGTYRKHSAREKLNIAAHHFSGTPYDNEPDPYIFLTTHGIKFPSRPAVLLYMLKSRASRLAKRLVRKIAGENLYSRLKKILRR